MCWIIDILFHMKRVLEDRVPNLLENLLLKPSLANPPPKEEGGLVLVSSYAASKILL